MSKVSDFKMLIKELQKGTTNKPKNRNKNENIDSNININNNNKPNVTTVHKKRSLNCLTNPSPANTHYSQTTLSTQNTHSIMFVLLFYFLFFICFGGVCFCTFYVYVSNVLQQTFPSFFFVFFFCFLLFWKQKKTLVSSL